MHSISICSRTRTIQQQPALPVSSDAQHDVKAATATSASVPTHSNSQTHETERCVRAPATLRPVRSPCSGSLARPYTAEHDSAESGRLLTRGLAPTRTMTSSSHSTSLTGARSCVGAVCVHSRR